MNVKLHLTDDTQLCAYGFVIGGALFAQVLWDVSLPDSPLGHDSISGTPEAMRRLADLATQAAIQAEEEACWQAHQDDATAAQAEGRVA
jgi:hypothetical protein